MHSIEQARKDEVIDNAIIDLGEVTEITKGGTSGSLDDLGSMQD